MSGDSDSLLPRSTKHNLDGWTGQTREGKGNSACVRCTHPGLTGLGRNTNGTQEIKCAALMTCGLVQIIREKHNRVNDEQTYAN
jgi:hypothetical protein